MDQEKIGKFIADCRKEKGLTQAALAEKLGITDRAVSKWETGKSLPDASIMLDLCTILNINVNELLTGEHITMEDYNEIAEQNLLEMHEMIEKASKNLLRIEVYLIVITIPVFYALVAAGLYMIRSGNSIAGAFILVIALVMILGIGSVGLKIEHDAGYYECPNCGERYVPSMSAVFLAAHIGRSRKMKCPHCGQKGYHKKVLTREKGGK